MLKGGKQHQLESALAQASTYQEWLSVAQELDAEDGLMDWRSSVPPPFFMNN